MKSIPAIVADVRPVTPTVIELSLRRTDGQPFPGFAAGQYATVSFPRIRPLRGERSFSIMSAPTGRSMLQFGVRIGGRYTKALSKLRIGEPAFIGGPYGDFTFDPARDVSSVMIAGGIGVTPFLSMIKAATDRGLENDLTLIYSVRSLKDVPFAPEIDAMQRKNPHFRAIYVISDGVLPKKSNRIIPGPVSKELLDWATAGTPWGRSFFLCGPSGFMTSMTRMLQSMGIPLGTIRTERFGIGSSALIERGTPLPKLMFAAWGTAAALIIAVVTKNEQEKRAVVLATPTNQVANTNTVPATTNTIVVNTDDGQTTVSVPAVTTPAVTTPTPTATTPSTATSSGSSSSSASTGTSSSTPTYTAPTPTYVPTYTPRTRMS